MEGVSKAESEQQLGPAIHTCFEGVTWVAIGNDKEEMVREAKGVEKLYSCPCLGVVQLRMKR